LESTTKTKTVAQLLVRCLENEGVKYVFGIPGEENIHFIDALENSSSIRFILAPLLELYRNHFLHRDRIPRPVSISIFENDDNNTTSNQSIGFVENGRIKNVRRC
jgi:Thiamine pyrophosphate enzyme, N-terminal TPP binding domain